VTTRDHLDSGSLAGRLCSKESIPKSGKVILPIRPHIGPSGPRKRSLVQNGQHHIVRSSIAVDRESVAAVIVLAMIKSPRGGTAQGSNAAASERARLLREKCKDGYEVGEAWPCLQRFAGKPGKVG